MRVIVTGVPGVGKSTCMKAASKAKNLEIVNFGDMMYDEARERGVKDRDQLRKMGLNTQKDIQRTVARRLSRMQNIIIDTHSMIQTPNGYFPGMPFWVIQKLEPRTIFVIEAKPSEIIARRSKDGSRIRDRDTEEEIALHQELNRMASVSYSTMTGATIRVVINSDGMVEKTVEAVISSL